MVPLPFAPAEYETRLTKIRREMSKRGLDLLIVNDVANQHYIVRPSASPGSACSNACSCSALVSKRAVWEVVKARGHDSSRLCNDLDFFPDCSAPSQVMLSRFCCAFAAGFVSSGLTLTMQRSISC